MKTSTFLATFTLGVTALAEPTAIKSPTKVERDIATVSSVVAQIQDAMVQLDTSVKAFEGDAIQLQADADNLVTTVTEGATAIEASGDIELAEALSLQDTASSLATAGETLITDLEAKKDQFEAADLCSMVETTVSDISTSAQSFVDGVVAKLPEEVQTLADGLTGGLTDMLAKGAAAFAAENCQGSGGGVVEGQVSVTATATAAESAVATSAGATVTAGSTVVVTSCSCEEGSETATSAVPVVVTSQTAIVPTTATTFRTNSTVVGAPSGTGAFSTSSFPSIPTAGAAVNGLGSVGVLAGLAAALFL